MPCSGCTADKGSGPSRRGGQEINNSLVGFGIPECEADHHLDCADPGATAAQFCTVDELVNVMQCGLAARTSAARAAAPSGTTVR